MSTTAARPRVVIAHDYLTQRGGAERVVLAMARTFPDAPIFTSLYQPDSTFPEFRSRSVMTSGLQHSTLLRRNHRLALPFYAPVFSKTRLDADLVVCSTSGWAHGVSGTGRRLLYVHNTARWLYQVDDYLRSRPRQVRRLVHEIGAPLRRWDRRHGTSADLVLANSATVRDRLVRYWKVDAEVLYPPYSADPAGERRPVGGLEPGFVLAVSRLVDHKRIDVLVEAARRRPELRVVIVGVGPLLTRLSASAPSNCRFLGSVPEEELRWCYANAVGFVSVSHEDLGLAALEAMAFGRPVAVLRAGGFVETVVEGETGLFFDEPQPATVLATITALSARSWDHDRIAAHAARFDEANFARRLREIVEGLMS